MSVKTQRKAKAEPVSYKVARKVRSSAPKITSKSNGNGKQPLTSYEHLHVGIVECSLDGKYINVNEEFCRIVGYSKEELLQRGVQQCTHEEDYALDLKLQEQLITGKIPFYGLEKRLVRKDGEVVWVELTRSLVRDAKGNPFCTMGVVIDISEYKQVERVLRESAENLRIATEAARMFKWELDFQKQLYTFADNFVQVLGFSADLLPQNSVEAVWRLSPEEDVHLISEAIAKATQHHSDLNSLQYRMIDPENGQTVWLEVNAKIVYDARGNPQRMFGVAQNITEEKRTREEIRILSRLPEENPNPVMRLKPDGAVLYANKPSQDLLEVWKQQTDQAVPDELKKHVAEAFASGTKREIEITQNEQTFSFTLAPIREAGYVNLYGNEITERKQIAQELVRERELLTRVFEAIPVMLTIYEPSTRVLRLNSQFQRLVGWSNRDAAGASLMESCYPDPEYRTRVGEFMASCAPDEWMDIHMQTREGRTLETSWSNIRLSSDMQVGIGIDITERKRNEQALTEYARQQEALYRLSDQLHHTNSLEDVYRAALDAILSGLQCDRASILLFDDTGVMRFVDWQGLSDEYRKATEGHSPWGPDEKNPYPVCIMDVPTSDLSDSLKAAIEKEGIVSLAFIPLILNGKLIGKFMVYFNAVHECNDNEIELGLMIARQLATGIERKRAEVQVRESEQRYRTIVDTANEGIWYTDSSTTTLYLNEPMAHILGYSAEEVIGRKVPEFCFDEDMSKAREHIASNYQGNYENFDFRFRRKDGSEVLVLASTSPVRDGAGKIIGALGMFVDVTDRKRAEEQLRESEERLRVTFDTAVVGFATLTPEARFVDVNDAFCQIVGYPREELLQMDCAALTHPFYIESTNEHVAQLVEGKVPSFVLEKLYVRKDGREIWVQNSVSLVRDRVGTPLHLIAICQDITERKQAEEHLRRSAEFDAFRVALTDALRPLNDPEKILAEAMRVLGEKLQVDRVLYSEIEDDDETIQILDNYVREGVPRLVGKASLNDYGKARGLLNAGQNLIIESATTSPDMDEKDRASFAALGILSGLAVPLIKNGRWAATLGVHHGAVRIWTANEIRFLEETAERTWSALERARAQEKLRASETLYRTIARSIPGGGVYVVGRDFRYLVAEGPVTDAFGLSPKMLEGQTVWEAFPGERGERMRERLERTFAGETVNFETKYDGHVYWTQQAPLHDVLGQAIIVTIDITERKQVEEALRQSEERFARFMQHLPGLAWIKDRQGRYVYANATAEKAFNTPREKLYGRTDVEIFPPEVAEQFRKNDEQALNEKGMQTVETLPQQDGIVHYSLVTKFPIPGPDGDTAMIGGTAFDITERLQAEEELRKSEERYRGLFDLVPIAVYTCNADGLIREYNQRAVELWGREPRIDDPQEKYSGAFRLYYPDGRPMPHEQTPMSKALAGETLDRSEVEIVIERPDGTRRHAIAHPLPLKNERGEIVEAINCLYDITEHKQAEEALRESEERFRAILKQATAGIVRKDAEGRFVFVNEAFCNMLGYSESELLGKNFWQFTYDEDIAENKRLYDRLMLEGIPFKLEKRVIRRDGSMIWIDASVSPVMDAEGKPQSAVAVEVDITGRKRAEEALQQLNLQLESRVHKRTATIQAMNQSLRDEVSERKRAEEALRVSEATARASEEKLRTLFDLLPVGISFLDPEGQVIEMNSALLNIVRLAREQILGQAYKSRKYIRADGTPMPPSEFAGVRALAEEKTIYNVETGIVLENGEVTWTSVSAAPVDVEDVGAVVVTVDITESKRAERALQESHGRLRVLSQRLVEVQEEERRALARELHDRVGQTLAALNINLIIINGQLSTEAAQQIGARLNDSMKLVAETIALVRDVMTDLRPAVLDDYGLEAALEAQIIGYRSRYNLPVEFEKPERPIPRLGPSAEMTLLRIAQEALMNIAKHAHAEHVTLSLRQEEECICLTIRDDGIGIESWQDANRPGSHGLTIMRERAEAFGGTLEVRSGTNQGTTVEVRIPFKNDSQDKVQKENS